LTDVGLLGLRTGGTDSTESIVPLPAVTVVWWTIRHAAGLAAEVGQINPAFTEDVTWLRRLSSSAG